MDDDASRSELPRHVAIIMDGNRRWAAARHLPRKLGHQRGVEAVRRTVRGAGELGIEFLTLYSFSSENWSRPAEEVNDLMGLLHRFIKADLRELAANGVRVTIIGERKSLSPDLNALIKEAEDSTKHNTKLRLLIAFNYGSQDEILSAARQIAEKAQRGELDPKTISREDFEKHLYTAGIPAPDLIIRTSGEMRLSNFLLWQSAYSEFLFTDTLWPDFDKSHLADAIRQYGARERRFGAKA